MKVLISDDMSPLAARVFTERGIEADVKTGLGADDLLACIGDYDGLAVRSATKVTSKLLQRAERLKVIGRAGIGIDNIDCTAATGAGILVMNTPLGNAITTAEHAIAMMLSLARQIPQANQSTHQGKWEKSRFLGVEVMGKTLGIIGCGNVGSIVADRAQGLKMKVIAFDPYLSLERAQELGVETVELDGLFQRADFISLHTPLTDATRGIIDAAAIAKMKPGVRIINCARGSLVVEADLKEALISGRVAAAALDVFAEEPAKTNILFGLENLVATPHLGAATSEAQEKVAVQVAEQMADFLLTGAVINALNMPPISAEEAPKLKPYMKLAEQIGSFAGQATTTGLKAVTIEYEGLVAALNTRSLSAVVLQGLLAPIMESVNMVNAPVLAKERGIAVTEVTREKAGGYQTLIRLIVTTEAQTRGLAGTLFNDEPRIVDIKGIPIDAKLGPNMLYITNRDEPGLIGGLGTIMGEAGINIATFHLGRNQPGGDAVALIEIDQPLDREVMQRICALPQVIRVQEMTF